MALLVPLVLWGQLALLGLLACRVFRVLSVKPGQLVQLAQLAWLVLWACRACKVPPGLSEKPAKRGPLACPESLACPEFKEPLELLGKTELLVLLVLLGFRESWVCRGFKAPPVLPVLLVLPELPELPVCRVLWVFRGFRAQRD